MQENIEIEFDSKTKCYYIIWNPPVTIGYGKTVAKALQDLRQSAHYGIDSIIDLKTNIITKKEDY